MRFLPVCGAALLAVHAAGAAVKHRFNGFTLTEHPDAAKRDLSQKYVTWDDKSLFINGERIMIFSGEVHPYRIPVPTLYIDIFQKIKALGFNTVSFYVDWALLEGKPGEYRADGVFALEPFFEAAAEAGIYLLARPGPYINAEVSGGGFPGWLQKVDGILRSSDKPYLEATDNYIAHVAATIAKYQITNGGPIILYQPENEYSGSSGNVTFPDPVYMQYVLDQARNAGIVVPFISNDASASGHNAPGTGEGSVNIYGHDSYPLGFDCANPSTWPAGNLPTNFRTLHLEQSPTTPYSIIEFQAGAFDPWGGPGFAKCAALVNHEFERVFYKNDFSFGVAILNLYMTFGGTNWGNLGYANGYTSYDYGSPLTESRNLTREKYSELKLLGNFAKASPGYLLATPGSLTTSGYADTSDITVTPLLGNNNTGSFFVVRHSDYTSQASTSYKLKVPTSAGSLTIPQLGGSLSLNGRDSKIHVVDYDVSGTNILYSTAEVFTWKKFSDGKVLVLYGGSDEHHELAITTKSNVTVVEGKASAISSKQTEKSLVIGWDVSSTRQIIKVGDLQVHLLGIDRNSAYNYWVPQVGKDSTSTEFSTQAAVASSIIVKAGYLVRTAYVKGNGLYLSADFNATTPIEVFGAPATTRNLYINGEKTSHTVAKNGAWTTEVKYSAPKISLPSLKSLSWKYLDTLPEIQSSYDDSLWTAADLAETKNTFRPLTTPTSLYSSDYGFHTGYLVYRGRFVASGDETTFTVDTQGGTAFGSSIWLNDTFLGSFTGLFVYADYNQTVTLPKLKSGKEYVFTVVVDNLGLDEDWTVGSELMKAPRGILNYDLAGHDASDISWKLTGNLGGEDYQDKTRGPLNEGGLYAERQGYHQPQPPSQKWKSASPLDGLSKPSIGFYSAEFELDLPTGWDVPLFFNFANSTTPDAYRAQLYVNGYQYGKYVSNIGPQTSFPVPQGILNYQGTNWIALSVWAQNEGGAKVEGLELSYETPVLTALKGVKSVDQPKYKARKGAY
ncbi:beta-galactosidase extracellular [Aspergillus uvarum CBS 121591]|uniref:Beta-galactosidase n=1 Tax=Aspergillus uvarum CBS 121591 TaxID=1448315 RepID=A0A319CS15_9EURO|nr:beta-galactosidase extracellular [Aspergillus uvarum CBS 121591]PYH85697.1 beta-galactosidase extracellular [Aspergillus uvarum CBS 121591]